MFEQIKNLLIETANVDANMITPSARLKEDLLIDSLYAVELILELETTYDIKIEWETMQNLKTVEDVCNLINEKTKNR